MTKRATGARAVWRIVRLTARYYDKTWPFWWQDPRAVEAISRKENDVATRCWQHAIRVREGR
jgi:hypothetical protein